jgi:serine protease inhibitor
MALAVACTKTNEPAMNNTTAKNNLKAVPARFADQSTDFTFAFWKKLDAETKNNYFVSPLSLHIALGMLLNGADGSTKAEIENVLKLGDNQQENNEIYLKLLQSLPSADPAVTNQIANSVWQRKDFAVEKNFTSNLQQYFLAKVYNEDFANPSTVGKINQWASDNTNAKIKKVLEEISDSQVMFLMNALYFKGNWAKPFDPKSTHVQAFHNANSSTSEVKMMNMTDKVLHTQQADYQAIELPYGNGNYAMTVLLPNEKTDINSLIAKLNPTEWSNIKSNLKEKKIVLSIPKFQMDYEVKLNKILASLGMPTAFTDLADLSKITPPAGKLKVGFVKQNTFVAVDEVGTEAAAVTTIGIELTSAPNYPMFIADRPFLFVIHEKNSNTIMFTGKIANL